MMIFLDYYNSIEEDEFGKKYSSNQIENVNHFIVFLARQEMLPIEEEESFDLENDIEELLNPD